MIGHNDHSFIADSNPIMHTNIRFNNFINIENYEEVKKSNATYIVVHKDLFIEACYIADNLTKGFIDLKQIAEKIQNNDRYTRTVIPASRRQGKHSIEYLKNKIGDVFYEDELIVVFKLN